MRTLKMSIVIVLSFIICWTPYYLLGLWHWFFPDDLEGKVSHSLTHILFIFGLINACLDPVIYGLFTIHFRKGVRRLYSKSTAGTDVDKNTVTTGSFTFATNSLSLRRELWRPSQEGLMLRSDNNGKVESSSPRSSLLRAENEGERDPNQSSKESILWEGRWGGGGLDTLQGFNTVEWLSYSFSVWLFHVLDLIEDNITFWYTAWYVRITKGLNKTNQ